MKKTLLPLQVVRYHKEHVSEVFVSMHVDAQGIQLWSDRKYVDMSEGCKDLIMWYFLNEVLNFVNFLSVQFKILEEKFTYSLKK